MRMRESERGTKRSLRHEPVLGLAAHGAPRSTARQRLPRQQSVAESLPRVPLYRAAMHGATEWFGRARAIDAVKSVRFENKNK
jgi:hypothetical protein